MLFLLTKLVDYERDRSGRDLFQSRLLFRHWPGGTEENHENFSQDSRLSVNWKGNGKKWSWAILRKYPRIWPERL